VVGLIVTAVIHPHGAHGVNSPEAMEHLIRLAIGTHALAITSVWLTLVGLIGLSRQLGIGRFDVIAALSAYGMAAATVTFAAAASGFIAPELIVSMTSADEAASAGWRQLLTYNSHLNGAMAKVHVAGSSLAIALWSLAMLRTRFAKVLPIVGFLVPIAGLAVIFNGGLHMSVHDLAHLVLAQSVWMVWAAVLLIRKPSIAGRLGTEDR
jgi:hypothetical protein